MTDGGGSFRLAALRCPACGGDLDGLDSDRVFGCRPCARAWSVEADGLRDSPLVAWAASAADAPLYLPIWCFELEAVVVLPPKARTSLPGGEPPAERIVPFPHPRAFVTAFALQGRRRFGDPGLHLTRRALEPQPAAGPLPALRGAVLARGVAEQLLPAVVLAVIDARTDVEGGRVDLQVTSAVLALVPFVRLADGGVQEPNDGMKYPPAALPDLAALLG
jgi:hypothetical protein